MEPASLPISSARSRRVSEINWPAAPVTPPRMFHHDSSNPGCIRRNESRCDRRSRKRPTRRCRPTSRSAPARSYPLSHSHHTPSNPPEATREINTDPPPPHPPPRPRPQTPPPIPCRHLPPIHLGRQLGLPDHRMTPHLLPEQHLLFDLIRGQVPDACFPDACFPRANARTLRHGWDRNGRAGRAHRRRPTTQATAAHPPTAHAPRTAREAPTWVASPSVSPARMRFAM